MRAKSLWLLWTYEYFELRESESAGAFMYNRYLRAPGYLVRPCLWGLQITALFHTVVYIYSGTFLLEDRLSLSQLLTAQLLTTQIYHFGNSVRAEELSSIGYMLMVPTFLSLISFTKNTWSNLAHLQYKDFFCLLVWYMGLVYS